MGCSILSRFEKDRQERVLALLDASGVRLHRLLGRLTLGEDVVGDLVQELFIRLSRSSGFDRAKDPWAYAYRAAINLAFEWRRKATKVRFESLDADCLPMGNIASPLAAMVRAEEVERVLDAVGRLRGLAREVVVMRYIEQETYEAIAGRLGKKPQHVRSVCAKGLARLRELLTGESSLPAGKEKSNG